MRLAILFLLLATLAKANELPEVPIAKPIEQKHSPHFWDTPNKIEFASMTGLAVGDMTQTCRFLSRGWREMQLTQSCPKDVAITAAFDAGAALAAFALHKTGHHKLERIPMLYMAGASARGIIESKVNGAW
jgi:hypothetical protein